MDFRRCGIGRRGADFEHDVFEHGEVVLMGNDVLHALSILAFGALCACGLHGGSAAEVEGLDLKCGTVGVASHFAAEGIEFVDEVALGESADRGVAGHAGDGGEARRNEQRGFAHAGGDERRLGAGMSAADDYYLWSIGIHRGDYSKLSTILLTENMLMLCDI